MTDPIAQLCQLIAEKLRDEPEASLVELVSHVEEKINENSELATALHTHQQMQQYNRDSSKGFQTFVEDGGTIFIEGTHYHLSDPEKFKVILEEILNKLLACKTKKNCEFTSYLNSLITHYEQWWDCYRLTEAISARQETFIFDQVLQTQEFKEGQPEDNELDSLPFLEKIVKYSEIEHILLVGPPGMGKSTTLLRLLVWLTNREIQELEPIIPVLVKLKDYQETDSSNNDFTGILALIQESLEPDIALSIQEIQKLLFEDKCFFLLLDGLNEIPASNIYGKLVSFRAKCERAKIPLVCTTRDPRDNLGIKKRLNLQPLKPKEIKRFVDECMPGQEQQVLTLLNKGNQELNKTPLVLWMIYDIFRKSGEVPESLGEAFQKFVESYTSYKLNQEGIKASKETLQGWNLSLEFLAFNMLVSPDPQNPGLVVPEVHARRLLTDFPSNPPIDLSQSQSLLNNLLQYHLLQKTDKGEVSFCHQLIQEYYAAKYLLQGLPNLLKNENKFQQDYLNYLKWTEPIALMLSLVTDRDQALQVVKLALDVDLRLGARLAGEAALAFHEATVGEVIALPVADWLKVELLGETRSEVAIPELLSFLTHSNINIAQAAASYIGETHNQAAIDTLIRRLDEISNKFFSQKSWGGPDKTGDLWSTHVQALSYLSPQITTQFLREKLEKYDILLLMTTQAASILMQLNAERIIPELLEEFRNAQHEENRKIAAGWKEPEEEIQMPDLAELAIHKNAAEAYRTIRFTPPSPEFHQRNRILNLLENSTDYELFVPSLIQAFDQESDETLQKHIIQILGKSKYDAAIHFLVQKLGEDRSSLRTEAAKQLIKLKSINNPEDLEELRNLAKHEDWNISWCAAIVLGHLKDSTVLPRMMYELEHHQTPSLRSTAAKVLGIIGDPSCVPSLLKAINHDSDRYVRLNSACALSNFGQKEAIPVLLDSLKAPTNADPHAEIMKSFSRFSLKEPLLEITQSKNLYWQRAAIELGKLAKLQGDRESGILPDLFKALEDPGHESSSETIDLLSELADAETLNCLIDALEYPEKYTRDIYFLNRVALALVNCRPEMMADKLTSLKRLNESSHISQLSWLVPTIQSRCKFYSYDILQAAQQRKKEDITEQIPQDSSAALLTQIDQTTRTTSKRIEKMADEPRTENKFEIINSPINAPIGTSGVTHSQVTVPDSEAKKGIDWGKWLAIIGIFVAIVAIPASMAVSGAFNEEFKGWLNRIFSSKVEQQPEPKGE